MLSETTQQKTQLVAVGGFGQELIYNFIIAQILFYVKYYWIVYIILVLFR